MTEKERYEYRLIEYLKETPNWVRFTDWFKDRYPSTSSEIDFVTGQLSWFIEIPFPFQKGVFEAFINDSGCAVEQFLNSDGTLRWNIWNGRTQEHISYREYIHDSIIKFFKHFKQSVKDETNVDDFPEFVCDHDIGI
jgi:hypothetical protein